VVFLVALMSGMGRFRSLGPLPSTDVQSQPTVEGPAAIAKLFGGLADPPGMSTDVREIGA
jgi:hypothetical protein